ncbi:MAG: PTS sugar transporter subunit IIA [Acidimicrobiia bacterium]|nr:PTS sugar transporter subunit IIA [Acidimicrobiia bacterium]MXX44782.1 PTS sugar transporter subunit IIA [Acidimicrobiia bacterium]MXY74189.1 PTS sugar transporter subunit IIA [Acidimicrobiia bacterium]MYA38700.1 PTS sugar transporter subunit IIA [Acidimicrobiia bacterium]MYB77848.1 PTS sugar transporter subunit IIA [Acidimicrobiia bacterium]
MDEKSVTSVEAITLGEDAQTQSEAIDRVAGMLFDLGAVEAGYGDSMRARETVISTYLGNGIALPHCTYEDRGLIKRTCLVLAQYPAGIPWGDEDDRAFLVFGLAAVGEEHLAVMSHLAEVLDDEDLCNRLAVTADTEFVRNTLAAEAE